MPDLTLVLLGAGNSTRFNQKFKKQWMRIGEDPLWLFVAKRLQTFADFKQIIVVANKEEIEYMKNFADYKFVPGGKERQISLQNALLQVDSKYVLVTDVARACVQKRVVDDLIENRTKADIIVPYIKVSDTVHYKNSFLDRDKLKLIQTPQLSQTKILKNALNTTEIFTDDSTAILKNGGTVFYVEGDTSATKLTYANDLSKLECLQKPCKDIFTGIGYDVHPFENDKDMFLCGVRIDVPYGFKAHSDGDVAIHAIIDALLGSIGAGDIGELFPDSDNRYKNIDSKILLKKVCNFVSNVGCDIVNIDITVIAQKPKLSDYKKSMRKNISKLLNIPYVKVNIKATTTEKLGFVGREEGVAVEAIANTKYTDWTSKQEDSI